MAYQDENGQWRISDPEPVDGQTRRRQVAVDFDGSLMRGPAGELLPARERPFGGDAAWIVEVYRPAQGGWILARELERARTRVSWLGARRS